MSTPSSGDLDHFPIHELQLKKAILRYLSHTTPDEEDGQEIL